MSTRYPYKSRLNALLSIQLYRSGTDSLDLKMTSNMTDDTDFLFPHPSLDAKRHGLFVAEFIKKHAEGRTLLWFIDFFNTVSEDFRSNHDNK